MKKLFLVLCLILSGLLLKSQIAKGTKMIGLRFNYNQNQNDYSYPNANIGYHSGNNLKQRNLNLTINAGYFLSKNMVLGALVGFSNYSTEQENAYIESGTLKEVKSKQWSNGTIYSLGVFGRAYKMIGESKIGFFGDLKASYLFGTSERNTSETVNGSVTEFPSSYGEIRGFNASLSPGVVYFITKTIGLEASFGNLAFTTQTETFTYEGLTQTIYETGGLNFSFSASTFNIGINFYFSDKKD